MLTGNTVVSHLVIAAVVAVGTVTPSMGPIVHSELCSQEVLAVFGKCPQANSDSVTLTGKQTTSDDGWDPTPGGNGPLIEGAGSDELWFPEPPAPVNIYDTCRDDVHEYQSCLGGIRVDTPTTPAPSAPAVPGTPGWSATVTDVARFVPTNATVAGEPDNIAVVGLPANFLSTAKTETVPGAILGRALTIRFTPVSYAFDYGDGEQRTSTTPGTAWDASGQAQFTPTDTSHVYKQPGTYTVSVTVTYAADVDLGTGWIPINGTLNGPPASQQIRVVKAHTALVQGTCLERPSAPGC